MHDAHEESFEHIRHAVAALCAGFPGAYRRAEHSDLMLPPGRTTPRNQAAKRSEGLSLILIALREARLYQIAPISTNLILAYLGEHVLGLPRSY